MSWGCLGGNIILRRQFTSHRRVNVRWIHRTVRLFIHRSTPKSGSWNRSFTIKEIRIQTYFLTIVLLRLWLNKGTCWQELLLFIEVIWVIQSHIVPQSVRKTLFLINLWVIGPLDDWISLWSHQRLARFVPWIMKKLIAVSSQDLHLS